MVNVFSGGDYPNMTERDLEALCTSYYTCMLCKTFASSTCEDCDVRKNQLVCYNALPLSLRLYVNNSIAESTARVLKERAEKEAEKEAEEAKEGAKEKTKEKVKKEAKAKTEDENKIFRHKAVIMLLVIFSAIFFSFALNV